MNITRDNYEAFFLDYLEGRLEENMIDEFLDFLELNPDLKKELHLFESIHLPEEQIVFPGKVQLYKSAAEEKSAIEIKTIAFMEGDLEKQERESFETYLSQHPELQREYDLFLKTRLVADSRIVYPYKPNLYKKSGTLLLLNWALWAAAAVFLFWGIHALFQPDNQTGLPGNGPQIASVKQPPVAPAENETREKAPETEKGEKPVHSTQLKPRDTERAAKMNRPLTAAAPSTKVVERDLILLEEIQPILASLEIEPDEIQLAVGYSEMNETIDGSRNSSNVEEFLASRVKKVGRGGLLSVNRILRTGLNVASELSGDRLGYEVKNGKITSLDFDSKLMAFSIPLEKK